MGEYTLPDYRTPSAMTTPPTCLQTQHAHTSPLLSHEEAKRPPGLLSKSLLKESGGRRRVRELRMVCLFIRARNIPFCRESRSPSSSSLCGECAAAVCWHVCVRVRCCECVTARECSQRRAGMVIYSCWRPSFCWIFTKQ